MSGPASEHRATVKGKQVQRVARSYEQVGRPDLALAVLGSRSSSVLPGSQFVTVEVMCGQRHLDGDGRIDRRPFAAASVHVDTHKRFLTFEQAWGRDGDGPGTWQSEWDAANTWTTRSGDGRVRWHFRCVRRHEQRRPAEIQVRGDRLQEMLRELWRVGVSESRKWPATG